MSKRWGAVVGIAVLAVAAGVLITTQVLGGGEPSMPEVRHASQRSVGFNVGLANELSEPIDLVVDGTVVLTIPPGGYSAEIPVRDQPRNGRWRAEARTADGRQLWSDEVRAGVAMKVRIGEGGVSLAGQPGAAEGTPDEYSENGR